MKINQTSNEIVIQYLAEIDELIQSEVFSIGDELKEESFRVALEYAIHKLKKEKTLLYKISLSDKESTQGFQLYDVSYKGEIIGTCSVKPLLKQSVDIYEIEKNGFTFIKSCNLTTLFKGGK